MSRLMSFCCMSQLKIEPRNFDENFFLKSKIIFELYIPNTSEIIHEVWKGVFGGSEVSIKLFNTLVDTSMYPDSHYSPKLTS